MKKSVTPVVSDAYLPNKKTFKKQFIENIPLLIMLLPFVCMAGVYRWSKEKVIFSADNFKKYFGISPSKYKNN